MTDLSSVVIVGGGLGGANAAFALRDEGFEGRVTIVGDEDEWPYERPPMSKEYLRAEKPLVKAYVRQPDQYEAKGVELLRGTTVTGIDRDARRVSTTAGDVSYDALILATGAAPRRLQVPGDQLEGIHYLRNAADADALREAAVAADNIVVVGGGWIGSEVAASLRQLGHDVTFLTSRPRPLEHVLGIEVADVYREVHVEHGVRFVTGRVASVDGSQRVEAIVTTDGDRIPADLVVVGIGAAPRIELAQQAHLRIHHGGVEVDDRLRSSDPRVYAIGDVASAWNPRYGRSLRLEHWDNAKRQGKTAAANIVGGDLAYDRVPYVYSDQYDIGMEYRGLAPKFDEVVIRGDVGKREFHAFWLQRGTVAAAMNVNLWDDGDDLQALVERASRVDVRALADQSVPLAELVAQRIAA